MRFPGGYGPSVNRRGGIYPARGRLRRRRVRRGEGAPPYGRPGGCACPVWPETPNLFVGAGLSRPGCLCRRRLPRAHNVRPYTGCAAGLGLRLIAGGSPRRLRRRGVRRGEGTPPYGRPGGCACPVWPETQNLFVGAGFIPPGVFVPPQGSPGAQCAPLQGVHGGVGFAVNRGVFPQPVGADSISARGTLRRRKAPGTISGLRAGPAVFGLRNAPAGAVQASSPTQAAVVTGSAVSHRFAPPPQTGPI